MLLQPLRWTRTGAVELRCPECESCFRALCSPADLRRLETRSAAAREELLAACEQLAAESIEALACRWGDALARDLLGADDF